MTIKRYWLSRVRYRSYLIIRGPVETLASKITQFATKRHGVGEQYSRFWYGIQEVAWVIACGHSPSYGLKMCWWIWNGCKKQKSPSGYFG